MIVIDSIYALGKMVNDREAFEKAAWAAVNSPSAVLTWSGAVDAINEIVAGTDEYELGWLKTRSPDSLAGLLVGLRLRQTEAVKAVIEREISPEDVDDLDLDYAVVARLIDKRREPMIVDLDLDYAVVARLAD